MTIEQTPEEEFIPAESELLERLQNVDRERKTLLKECRSTDRQAPHFTHVANNLLAVALLSMDFAQSEDNPLTEAERRKIDAKLSAMEKYLNLFEDPWFREKELRTGFGAFGDGKVYSGEEYVARAARLLKDRHDAEVGLA